MTLLRRAALAAVAVLLASGAAAQSLPPPPSAYVNDYAGVLPPDAEAQLEARLRAFDAETSSQILVAVFPKLPSASLEDFTIRTAQSWRVGRGKLNNGVVLFVFVQDRKIRMETGYGLEGALPDAIANRIIDEQIVPALRQGDYAGGLARGLEAVMQATRGEYKAPPRPAARGPVRDERNEWLMLLFILIVLAFMFRGGGGGRSRTFSRRGGYYGGFWGGGGGLGGGGGSFGGFGGGGGGGFSGGGGSFGGGGASGSW